MTKASSTTCNARATSEPEQKGIPGFPMEAFVIGMRARDFLGIVFVNM
jgi:hypothetical protein